jgi:hypothetical protein
VAVPADVAMVLTSLTDGLVARGDFVGLYVYGSLTTGDYSPASSDIDVVVLLSRAADDAGRQELVRMHEAVARSSPVAERLHCLYVPADSAADPDLLHDYWFGEGWHGERMTQWQLKVMTRAELMSAGWALHGPWPPPGIEPVPVTAVQAAVRAEITGHWRAVARRRSDWWSDTSVDHALVMLPRARAVLTAGELITKSQAISRLADFGVPAWLAAEIRDRRDGRPVAVPAARRARRAVIARRIMRRGVRTLGALSPAPPREDSA